MGLACAFGVFIGAKMDFTNSEPLFASNPKKEKLNRLIDYIDYEYVDDVNTDSIVDVAVNEILSNLDPHSVYLPKEEYAAVTESMKGDFVGIGVSFFQVNDTIVVIQAIEGGPSKKEGIVGGDRILYANNKKLFGNSLNNEEVIDYLKGEINTEVDLKIYRKSEDTILNFTINRGHVPLKSVDAAYMLTDDLGYIKINRFAESTYEEFRKALKELIDKGATKLTLDLRDNPGGYLSEAIKIADEFLKEDLLILFTKNRSGNINKTYAEDDGLFEGKEVYVLINENSASASEIVAGALQDNDIGTIIGRRSYGKGLVQREMDLGDGSAVRLTIARYYTPTGRSIQKPYNQGNKEYFNDYLHRYENGELKSADSINVVDSLKYVTPGGKIVYGGGGIIPDVFIPKNIESGRTNIEMIQRSGLMNKFVFEILEKDRNYYNSLDLEEFQNSELISDSTINDFLNFLHLTGLNPPKEALYPVLKHHLKATMAQQLFGSNIYEEMMNRNDKVVERVKKLAAPEGGSPVKP